MKNIIILLLLLFQITALFAQQTKEINKKGPSGIVGLQRAKQDIPKNNNSSSNSEVNNANSTSDGTETISNWMPASTCFPEIYYQVKTRGPSHPRNYKHDGTYSVWIKFKNVSGKAVKFWAKIAVPNSTRGEFELNYQLAPGTIDQNAFGETHATSPPSSIQVNIFKATYNISTTNYIECNNGIKNSGSNNIKHKTNSSNTSTANSNSKNNLDEYNRSKQEMEAKLQQENAEIQRQNVENANKKQQFINVYNEGVVLGNTGKYAEAATKYQQAIDLAINETDRQNAQNAYNKVTKAQRQTAAINLVGNVTTELIDILSNRKRANKTVLSREDVQILLGIVSSETPLQYAQNIVDIFTDLGYSHKSTEKTSNGIFISMFDNSTIQWPLFITINTSTKYDAYNNINFDYQRKDKLKSQLSALGDNLDGWSIKGISPRRKLIKLEEDKKKLEEDKKKLDDKNISVVKLIEDFERNNYWHSSKSFVFYFAKEIAESYQDENKLNNKEKAILYFKKAATIHLDTLVSSSLFTKNIEETRKRYQKELAKVFFEIGYLTDEMDGAEAVEWYKKAIDFFKISSYKNIARIYRYGLGGVSKNWGQAKDFYEKAAEEKDASAMKILGSLYSTGGVGLSKDEGKSQKWFKKAREVEEKDTSKKLKNSNETNNLLQQFKTIK